VAVIDQDVPGQHASTLNFGAVGRTIRPKFSELYESYGEDTAKRIFQEAKDWLEFAVSFIEREQIDCGFRRAGRLYACHTPETYEALARELEFQQKFVPTDSVMIPRAEQHREVGSDTYFGLQHLRDVGHLHPGRYYRGILDRALGAGVRVFSHCKALGFAREGKDHVVRTSRGTIVAKELVLCTNAVTGTHAPLLRRFRHRIVPVNCWTAVTKPADEATYRALLPTERMLLETVLLYTGMRPIDEDRRFVIAAQHLYQHRDAATAAAGVKAQVAANLPAFERVEIDHCWNGTFAMTFDWLPHLGTDRESGAHYLLGLVGTGVPSSIYFGHKLANRILGRVRDGESVYADRPFPTRPFYTGHAGWILPFMRGYYRQRDFRARDRALARHGLAKRAA
jgi:glycine/D-amino acid oxidase-like deaminating enzyme